MSDIAYSDDHRWVRVDDAEENIVTIGLTEFGQNEVGDVVFVEVPDMGGQYNLGDEVTIVESVKAAVPFVAPVSGEVVEFNHDLEDAPELINDSPTDKGWVCKMVMSEPAEFGDLMTQDSYSDYISSL